MYREREEEDGEGREEDMEEDGEDEEGDNEEDDFETMLATGVANLLSDCLAVLLAFIKVLCCSAP